MKVALIIERFNPAGGGAERSTAQMAHELVKAGHEVTILTGSATTADGDKSESLAYQVESLGLQGRFGAFKLWQFARWSKSQAQQSRFDVSLSVTTTVPASVVQPRSETLQETFQRNIAMHPYA